MTFVAMFRQALFVLASVEVSKQLLSNITGFFMNKKSHYDIDKLFCLTEEMATLASAGDWDEVEVREAQRTEIISSWHGLADNDDENYLVAEKLKQILDLNTKIVALAVKEKNKFADEIILSKRLEKAEKTYRDVDTS